MTLELAEREECGVGGALAVTEPIEQGDARLVVQLLAQEDA